MKLALDWSHPVKLRTAGSEENLIYKVDDGLPNSAGVYIFGRRFNKKFEALYVGQAGSIRSRVQTHLKGNVSLMLHLRKAKNGQRVVLAGRFLPKPGQQEAKCLKLLERALLRYFLSEGHDLVNKQGARLSRHEVASRHPRGVVPALMFVDRGKGE